jgi:hypothetical protein
VLGVEHTVIEWVDLESDGRGGEVLVAQVRLKAGWRGGAHGAVGAARAMTPVLSRGGGGVWIWGLPRYSSRPRRAG